MRYTQEDNIKQRLTNRAQLEIAVEKMLEQGVAEELIPVHLARIFYVDLDELNAALAVLRDARGRTEANENLPAVA